MKYKIIKKLVCTDAALCSDAMIKKLEDNLHCVFSGNGLIKEVHGSLSILHEKDNHIITVEFYEKNEAPNAEHKNISLKKLDTIPSEGHLRNII